MEEMIKELREAGYTEEFIAKEVKYMERVQWENERIRSEPGWNYGFMGPDSIDD